MRILTGLLLCLCVLTSGCSDNDKPDIELSEKEYYNSARRNLDGFQFALAITDLQQLESRYPFGDYAEQAQLDIIYAYYMNFEPEAAAAAADRFIRLHPQHPNADYAYYMKGLSSFSQGSGLFERFLPTDMTRRDPGAARDSFSDFAQLVARYPQSPYAADAHKRMIHLRNRMARYEIHAANYYFKRKAYLAAGNRGRYVVENFQQTPAVPDGLAVMIQAYHLMEMDELANESIAVLRANYPNHPSLDGNGEFIYQIEADKVEASWTNTLSLGLFDQAKPPQFNSSKLYNPEAID